MVIDVWVLHSDKKILIQNIKTVSSDTKQFDLWCISILNKKKTFSANNFLSGTV